MAGESPETAMAPTGSWMELPAGKEHWYQFSYLADTGPEHDGDLPLITVSMSVEEPADNARFDVWTQEEIDRLVAEGEDITAADPTKGHCVGTGSADEFRHEDYSWSGTFPTTGVYYVRVQHTHCRCEPAYYQLLVSGRSVSY